MKFKREKQKLVIELNGREEDYLKQIADHWTKNAQIKKLAGSTVIDVKDNLMENFSKYLATREPNAEYETRGWIAQAAFELGKKEGELIK